MPSPVWFSSFRTRSAEDNKINRLKRIMKNIKLAEDARQAGAEIRTGVQATD